MDLSTLWPLRTQAQLVPVSWFDTDTGLRYNNLMPTDELMQGQSERRTILKTLPNPERLLDYISVLTGHLLSCESTDHSVRLRYVPAAVILEPKSWDDYLTRLGGMNWNSLEHMAVTMLADINDQLVPRWIEISVQSTEHNNNHHVIVDDRQPGWNNEDILARIDSF